MRHVLAVRRLGRNLVSIAPAIGSATVARVLLGLLVLVPCQLQGETPSNEQTFTEAGLPISCAVSEESSNAAPVQMDGTWKGYWKSSGNGHKGRLRARFTRISPDRYQATFTGTFLKIVPFVYRAQLQACQQGGQLRLTAKKNLGPLLGGFQITAVSNGQHFSACFSSGDDRGRFELTRVGG